MAELQVEHLTSIQKTQAQILAGVYVLFVLSSLLNATHASLCSTPVCKGPPPQALWVSLRLFYCTAGGPRLALETVWLGDTLTDGEGGGGKEGKEGEGMKREKEVKVGEEKEEMEERYIVKDTYKIGKESLVNRNEHCEMLALVDWTRHS